MSDANAKTVTLPISWNDGSWGSYARPQLYLGRCLIGQVVGEMAGGVWHAHLFNTGDTTSHPDRASAQQALEDAVLAMGVGAFQRRVDTWIQHCFGSEIGADKIERNHRFIEEALELVQAGGCTASEAHQLVDYVYNRPVGELDQEVGGVMNTLAAFCNAHGIDLDAAAERELTRVWGKSEKIRAKQAAKPKHSPLPEHVASPDAADAARFRWLVKERCGVEAHYGRITTAIGWGATRSEPTDIRSLIDSDRAREGGDVG
jgi:NTP pyrophosphatase (non-canonical NTP hydrolase)